MASLIFGLFRVAFFLLAVVCSFGAILAAFGFAYPILDAFNHLQPIWFLGTLACLLLTGAFFRRERSRALMIALSATGFLASGIIVMPEIVSSFVARPAVPHDARSYRLLSYNVFGRNGEMQSVSAMIHAENPDVVALVEYFPEQRGPLHPLLVPDYPYFAICTGGRRANLALYSRLPFTVAPGEPCAWDAEDRTGLLTARFSPNGADGFAIVATQLDWPVQVSVLAENGDIATRIDAMTARQRNEFAHVAKGIAGIKGPLLVVGDFNSTPWSYALRRFAHDSGLTRNTRNLPTFPKLWFFDDWRETPAILPLDHVMSRGGAVVTGLHTGSPAGSDHLPVITDFSVVPAVSGL